MKILKKTFLLTALTLLCMLLGVHAAENPFEVSYNSTTGQIEVSGDAAAGTYISVEVFRQKDHLDGNGVFSLTEARNALLAATYPRSVICFADQTTAGEDGKWKIAFDVVPLLNDTTGLTLSDALSDIYVVSVFKGNTHMYQEILYIDKGEKETSFSMLGGYKTAAESVVIDFLKTYKYSLGAYLDLTKDINTDSAYALMYDELVRVDFTFENADSARALLQKAIAIEALNQNKIDNIQDYENELGLKTSSLFAAYYNAELVDGQFKSDMTNRLKGKSFTSAVAFDKAATDAILLEYAAHCDGVTTLANIISALDSAVWGEETAFSEAAVRSVMGSSYENTTLLKTALSSYKGTNNYQGGSASSGGGYRDTSVGTSVVTPPVVSIPVYSDMQDAAWAQEAVEYITEKGIVSGNADGTFTPNRNVTRAEFVKMVVKAFDFNTKADDIAFEDVTSDKWYYDYVSIAYHNGIARGMGSSFFGAEGNITRQDMAVMLYNAVREKNLIEATQTENKFADTNDISDYAMEAVNAFSSKGIISGTGNDCFSPRAFTTRAQAAQIIYNLLIK